MDRQQHDKYVDSILSIEQEFDNLDLSDLTLTDEEDAAIQENIPQETIDAALTIVDAYTPQSGVDVRRTIVFKLLGLIATRMDKNMRRAFDLGWDSV